MFFNSETHKLKDTEIHSEPQPLQIGVRIQIAYHCTPSLIAFFSWASVVAVHYSMALEQVNDCVKCE